MYYCVCVTEVSCITVYVSQRYHVLLCVCHKVSCNTVYVSHRYHLLLCMCHAGIMNKACEYRNTFDTYAYLWVDDRNEFMNQFLLYNHVLTAEEIESHTDEGVPECPPTLDQFKDQVCRLELIPIHILHCPTWLL